MRACDEIRSTITLLDGDIQILDEFAVVAKGLLQELGEGGAVLVHDGLVEVRHDFFELSILTHFLKVVSRYSTTSLGVAAGAATPLIEPHV